jgi:hypothetical protein
MGCDTCILLLVSVCPNGCATSASLYSLFSPRLGCVCVAILLGGFESASRSGGLVLYEAIVLDYPRIACDMMS